MTAFLDDTLGLVDRRWWLRKNKLEIAEGVFSEVERIDRDTVDRQQDILESCALYGTIQTWPGAAAVSRVLPASRRISHNVIATATDALVAEVTQSVPRPMAVTVGGTFKDRLRAKKLTKYWEAKFDQEDVHDLGRQAVRDCILAGIGILRPYRSNPLDPESDSVKVERIFPGNFLIDDRAAIDVIPRQCYIRRFIDRTLLIDLFPKFKNQIRDARAPDQHYWFSPSDNSSVVEVNEAWHCASLDGRDDGMHVICVNNALLYKSGYDRIRFPMSFVRPVPPQRGFWGDGLVKRAAPAQFELNKLLRRVQESMHLHAVPRVFLQRQSGIVKAHMQNDVGVMVEYDGNPPVFLTPASMGADVFQHIQTLEQWIYKEMGVSELSANSKKPVGLDSGAALRTYNDVQSRRWINLERSYEQLHTTLARELALLEKDIAESNSKHSVDCDSKDGVDQVLWKDIELPDNRYRTRVYSASALPNTPAGKLQALEEMVKAGVIDQQTFIELADVPDLDSVRDLKVAPRELLEMHFEDMIAGGKYVGPEPYNNLQMGMELASLMIQKAQREGADEENIDKLRRWIGQAIELPQLAQRIQQAEMQAQAQAGQLDMQAAMPPGPPPEDAAQVPIQPNATLSPMTATPTQGVVPPPYQ